MTLVNEDELYYNYQFYLAPCYLFTLGKDVPGFRNVNFAKMLRPHTSHKPARVGKGWVKGRSRKPVN